jgi:hypothetical protein
MRLLAGVDVGTTHVKVGFFDERGGCVVAVRQPTPRELPALVAAVTRALGECAARAGRGPEAIGVAGMAETGVPLDRAGRPLTPLLWWDDPRAAREAAELSRDAVALYALRGLLPLGAGVADALQHLGSLVGGKGPGLHRLASRRQFVEGRDVEVGEVRHRQRARDRRGAHHQLVRHQRRGRGGCFFPQREPLLDAEAVLLVHHHQPEARESHVLLDQGVRADQHARLQRLAFLGLFHAAAQVAQANPEGREPLVELAPVLLGQDLGGRHDRGLRPRIHRGEAGDGRHHGLAAADIALQQALHRMALAEVAQHFLQGARLRPRELERQGSQKVLQQRAVDLQHRGPARAAAAVG